MPLKSVCYISLIYCAFKQLKIFFLSTMMFFTLNSIWSYVKNVTGIFMLYFFIYMVILWFSHFPHTPFLIFLVNVIPWDLLFKQLWKPLSFDCFYSLIFDSYPFISSNYSCIFLYTCVYVYMCVVYPSFQVVIWTQTSKASKATEELGIEWLILIISAEFNSIKMPSA